MSALLKFESGGPVDANLVVVNNLNHAGLARRQHQRSLGDGCRLIAYLGQRAIQKLISGKAKSFSNSNVWFEMVYLEIRSIKICPNKCFIFQAG